MKEYTLTRIIDGELQFLRELHGDDCYTGELSKSLLMDRQEAQEHQLEEDGMVRIVLDADGDIERWEPVGEETDQ